jgi:hypothetical protein
LVLSGQVVSEENILVIVYGRTTDAKGWQRIRWAKKKGGAYYFLSMVKSQKMHGFNNNFLICNRWNGTFSEFNTPSRSPKDYIIHWK